jgi:hypothetical protein
LIVETDRNRFFHCEQCITNVILERETGSNAPSTKPSVQFVYRLG